MNRRNFLRDTALTIAASLLPRILQPAVPEVQEEMVEIEVTVLRYPLTPEESFQIANTFAYWMPMGEYLKDI